MAWRWIPQAIETGVVTDPRDLVRNQAEFAGEFNGHLDRDNVLTGQITIGYPQVQALVSAGQTAQSGAPLQVLAAGETGQWQDITSVTTSVTTDDGEVIVDADVNATKVAAGGGNEEWACRLLINGEPVAHTGWTQEARRSTVQSLTGSAPVSKGTTTIQVQVRVWAAMAAFVSNVIDGTAYTGVYTTNAGYTIADLNIVAACVCWVHRKR